MWFSKGWITMTHYIHMASYGFVVDWAIIPSSSALLCARIIHPQPLPVTFQSLRAEWGEWITCASMGLTMWLGLACETSADIMWAGAGRLGVFIGFALSSYASAICHKSIPWVAVGHRRRKHDEKMWIYVQPRAKPSQSEPNHSQTTELRNKLVLSH